MSTKIIVSYDGTANEDDAIALGRMFARAGAEVALAYVRHTHEPDRERETLAQHEAEELLERGAALLGDADVAAPRRHRPLHPRGPARARRADGAERGRVLLGLAHRQGSHRDRQLRAAPARGRPSRCRDRARRPGRQRSEAHVQRSSRSATADGGARDDRRGARRRARREVVPVATSTPTCWWSTRARRPSRAASSLSASADAPDRDRDLRRCWWCRAASRCAFGARGSSLSASTALAGAVARCAGSARGPAAKSSVPPSRWPSAPVHSQVCRTAGRPTDGACA